MDSFFEQLLNGVYRDYQQKLNLKYGLANFRSTLVKFGGFQFSHNWYGKTDLVHDKIGDRLIFTKTIYFNSLFLTNQFGITAGSQFDLKKLVNSIAHEIAHCLLADYHPLLAGYHGELHTV